uniref:Uncharacterized protein n=1 Tax=Panagrolaimus sp. ES5 TaxID=591445 RepID=A0AC34FVF8_9BILA
MEEDDFTNPEWHTNNAGGEDPERNGNHLPPYNFKSPINDWTHSKRILDVAENNYRSAHLELIDNEDWLKEYQIHQQKIKDMTTENTPHEMLNDLTAISYFLHAKYCQLLDKKRSSHEGN